LSTDFIVSHTAVKTRSEKQLKLKSYDGAWIFSINIQNKFLMNKFGSRLVRSSSSREHHSSDAQHWKWSIAISQWCLRWV